jgi:hypothetical protein
VVQRLLAAVVLQLAIKRTVLAVLVVFPLLVMLWVWVLAIQPTFRRCGLDFFISCESWEPKRFSVEIMRF